MRVGPIKQLRPPPWRTDPGIDLVGRQSRDPHADALWPSYRVVFSSPDYHAKLSAVQAGIGIAAIPKRLMPPFLVCAKEYYLPELPSVKAVLCARSGLGTANATALLNQLSAQFFRTD